MSHLTANPFQRPYEFPRVSPGPLLTPPDTESEYQNQIPPVPAPNGLGIDLDPSSSYRTPSATEVPTPARKTSSLHYVHSGPKDMRDRVMQRGAAARWLLVVVPPASITQEHGHLGHTLSVGQPTRLSQGILMPLHSTLSNQLTAIAREFGFPSTTGLCLYLHTSYNGSVVSPRISDETWHLLWQHLFEPRSPTVPPSQLPVGGKVEFDIDLKKARWYEAWLGLGRRDMVDVPQSVTPSRPGSVSHWREDSRTTILDDRGVNADDQLDEISLRQLPRPSRPPTHRHIPRKLSLLDRLESSSVRSSSKFLPRNQSPPSPTAQPETRHPLSLSPIVQETSEPATAKKDIDRFVNSWRVSASIAPSPMAATGQTSLDPVNMPNDVPIEDGEASSELNLDDFQWSVSSDGPPDYDDDEDLESWGSWRLPSIHLDRRMEGSVLLSPTTCTSFGPPDWDEDARSYMSYVSRLPSPDLAARMFDDCPPTPSTATSWGPPLSYPPSPSVSLFYAPSPDIGARLLEDCPPTPSTATSWGPPSYPPSPVLSELSWTYSVDIGQRCMSEVPLTPSTATSWGPPMSWPATPATPYHVDTPDAGQRAFDVDGPPRPLPPRPAPGEEDVSGPWQSVWPYVAQNAGSEQSGEGQSGPWQNVWPYNGTATSSSPQQPTESGPWKSVWPYNSTAASSSPQQPTASGPWKSVWPYNSSETPVADTAKSAASPYSFVFPRRPASPAEVVAEASSASREVPQQDEVVASEAPQQSSAPFSMVWPYFNVFKDEAPTAEIAAQPVYREDIVLAPPPVRVRKTSPFKFVFPEDEDVHSSSAAEVADTQGPRWKEVWPYNRSRSPALAEGEVVHGSTRGAISVRLQPAYPLLQLYAPVYPHLEIYPAIPGKGEGQRDVNGYPGSVYNIYPAVSRTRSNARSSTLGVNVKLSAAYPNLEFYPAVYPYNLDNIYPSTVAEDIYRRVDITLKSQYPVFEIYAPVYPHNLANIYPPVSISEKSEVKHAIIVLRSSWPYPALDIYPAVYPWNMENIYPAPAAVLQDNCQVLGLPVVYPNIVLYSPVYPYNLDFIYPATSQAKHVHWSAAPSKPKGALPRTAARTLQREHGHIKQRSSITHRGSVPPVPPLPQNVQRLQPISPTSHLPLAGGKTGLSLPVQLDGHYPRLCLYPPVYPHMDLYPEVAASAVPHTVVYLEPRYPALNIYRAVYPYIEIYPQAAASRMASKVQAVSKATSSVFQPRRRPTRSHRDLHEEALRSMPAAPISAGTPSFLPRRAPRFSHRELVEQVLMTMPPTVKPVAPIAVETPRFLARRAPKFSHRELHEQTLATLPPVAAPAMNLDFEAILQAAELSVPAVPRQPPSPRKLPVPPQISVVPIAPSDPSVPSPPSSTTSSTTGSPSIRSRIRSGTVSSRPPLPTPPPTIPLPSPPMSNPPPNPPPSGPLPATPSPPHTPPSEGSPRIARRLPSVPVDITGAQPQVAARPSSMVHGVGLPTDPAAMRRASGIGFSRKASFSPLPTVPEPDALVTPVSSTSSRSVSPSTPLSRPLPQPLGAAPVHPGLQRSGSESARLPPPSAPMEGASELSRANTLPARPLSRVRRGSVATQSGGLVAGLANRYDSNPTTSIPEEPTKRLSMSTLSQFPTVPRPPLPPLPNSNSRPVSKLDRSKYPFA